MLPGIGARGSAYAHALVLAALVALLGAPAHARRSTRAGEIARFPLTARGNPSAKLIESVERALDDAIRQSGTALVSGAQLSKRLRTNVAQAVGRCATDTKCLTRLAQRAKAATLVTGRVTENGAGIRVVFLVVGGTRARPDGKVTADIAPGDDVAARLAPVLTELLGAGPTVEPELVGLAGLALEPVPGSEAGTAPTEPATPSSASPDAGAAAPGSSPDDDLPELVAIAAEPPLLDAPVSVAPGDAPPTGERRWLFYGGVASTGLGALLVGVGSYYGLQSRSLLDEAEDRSPRNELNQVRAKDKEQQGWAAADRANLFFGIGGIAVTAGAAMVGYDIYRRRTHASTDVGVQVSAGPGGATLLLTW